MPDVDPKRWAPIERIGRALHGDERWVNKLAADIGISTGLMTMMKTGERPITDKTLNRVLEAMTRRKRIDLLRAYVHIQTAVGEISDILGDARTVDIAPFDREADWTAARYEAEMDRKVQRAVDVELAKLLPSIDAVITYPSADNIAALAAVRDRYRPIDEDQEQEMK